jgi:hypothetical protein
VPNRHRIGGFSQKKNNFIHVRLTSSQIRGWKAKLHELSVNIRNKNGGNRGEKERNETQTQVFLGVFAKLQKATISFVMSLSVRMDLGSQWTDFHEISYFHILRQFVEKIHLSLKSDKNNGYFTRRSIYVYNISLRSS